MWIRILKAKQQKNPWTRLLKPERSKKTKKYW